MMKLSKWISLVLILAFNQQVISCQDTTDVEKNWSLSGYYKSLHGLFLISEPSFGIDETLIDGFFHHRLNFEWLPSEKWTIKTELRNRLFYGDLPRSPLFPGFKAGLSNGNDVYNLELLNVGEDVILHSIIDRLSAEYTSGDWEVTLGRQRINWGINTVWNPHDIFNAFTFTDFDYEERPGSDAIRIKKYTGYTSSVEVAFKAFESSDEIVAGLLWKWNTNNTDWQVLAGRSFEDWVLGFGWAGAIGQVGFKGEMSYFASSNNTIEDAFAATVSWDYIFSNGAFAAFGILYNSSDNNASNLFAFDLSARNLYPFRWSTIYSANFTLSPLSSFGLSMIHSPIAGHPLFINPTFTYSLSQNLDLDFVGQLYFEGVSSDSYRSPTKVFYLRFKLSF